MTTNPPFRLDDWHRLLFGLASWPFLLEVLLRTSVTWGLLILTTRLLGRRTAAQYTLFDLSMTVTLAAAIGVPLQASNRGMLPPFIIAIVAIGLQRVLTGLSVRHRRIENVITTDVSLILQDGRLNLTELQRNLLPREKIYEVLRLRGVRQLGEISRLYMEPSGNFSIVLDPTPRPGLMVIPRFDTELRDEATAPGWYACRSCGQTAQAEREPDSKCTECGMSVWTPAGLALKS
jgi:uncharacterized membrane protein YcaP (DUF421 family)